MKTSEIVGVEALARWENNSLGPLSPNEFITIAEDGGMVAKLGEYLLDRAFSQAAKWHEKYKHFTLGVSINLSPYQVMNQRFFTELQHYLK